jgi:glycosyltransferase involved in cell wall biosynthesis
LKIVGPDFLNGDLQKVAGQLGVSCDVEFVGAVPHHQLIDYYHWADVFILTSLSEGQNNSITEAMMCGLLPVSTLVGSMDNQFGSQVGVVAVCKDYKALANGIVDLYNRPKEWEEKRQAAFRWASHYNLDWTIIELKTILNNE